MFYEYQSTSFERHSQKYDTAFHIFDLAEHYAHISGSAYALVKIYNNIEIMKIEVICIDVEKI